MCTLPPYSAEEKNDLSRDVHLCLPSPLQLLETVSLTALFCHFPPFILPPNFVSIYCPLVCCITLSAALIVPQSGVFSPTLLTNSPRVGWPPLKSWLLWLAVCDKGLQAKPALMITKPHHLNGNPPSPLPQKAELTADWVLCEPMRAGLSLGQVAVTTEDVGI